MTAVGPPGRALIYAGTPEALLHASPAHAAAVLPGRGQISDPGARTYTLRVALARTTASRLRAVPPMAVPETLARPA